jgi:UDP-N-acetyl-2-amino-2-deoxyglucuronate dehydrogenase
MAKIRFGLIGCGRIFPKHVESLKRLEPEVEIAAVCDLDSAKANAAAKGLGVPAYTDHLAMLAKEKLDVVNILTWSGNHAPIAIECAGKVANIVVEKPMSLRLDHADKLIEACKRNNSRLFVVKQNRFNPPIVALRKAVDEGRFGRLLMGTVRVRWSRSPEYYRQDKWRGTWALDGGALTNQASHFIDMLIWFFGPVKSVYAKTATFLAPIESEDTGVAVIEFESGALGTIEATTCTRPKDLEGSISILGEKGSVELSGFAANQVRVWNFLEKRSEDESVFNTATNPPNVYGFGHRDFLSHVVRCIRDNVPAMIDGAEGRRSLELIHAIYESAALKREVFMKDLKIQHSRLGKEPNEP